MSVLYKNTLWQVLNSGRVEKITHECFRTIAYKAAKEVRYLIPLGKEADPHTEKKVACPAKQVPFFINFLRTFLKHDTCKWGWQLVKVKRKSHLLFRLKMDNANSMKCMMYLTAFRYLQDFRPIVDAFYKASKKKENDGPEAQFALFQQIHHDISGKAGTFKNVYAYNLEGHGLLCPHSSSWYGTTKSSKKIITLAHFAEKLAKHDSSVQGFFGD